MKKIGKLIVVLGCFVLGVLFVRSEAKAIEQGSCVSKNGVMEYTFAPGTNDGTDYKEVHKVLDANKNGKLKLIFKPGDYYINASWKLFNNTTIVANGATFHQTKNGKGFLQNAYFNGSEYGGGRGGYDNCANITIDGGTWIGRAEPDTSKPRKSNGYYPGYSGMMFLHGKNITIRNANFINNYNGHFIEFGGITNGKIQNCSMNNLTGKYVGEGNNEAIQIDNTYRQSNSPVGAPWDDTTCKNILIEKCKIKYARGIGTNLMGNRFFENITIRNCKIATTKGEGINMYDTKGIYLIGNQVTVGHRANNYQSTGVYIGLASKISNWGKYKTVLQKNTITGYYSGVAVTSFVKSKFNRIEFLSNQIKAKKSKKYALRLAYKGKQIKKLVKKKNKLS